MDWKTFFTEISNNTDLQFFNPISQKKIKELENKTGVILSGDLLEVLKETNGVRDINDYYLYPSDVIIKRYKEHLDYLATLEKKGLCNILFFADDGCGNGFGHKFNDNGIIEKDDVGIYYLIENKFEIISPDFKTWVKKWYSGELGV